MIDMIMYDPRDGEVVWDELELGTQFNPPESRDIVAPWITDKDDGALEWVPWAEEIPTQVREVPESEVLGTSLYAELLEYEKRYNS